MTLSEAPGGTTDTAITVSERDGDPAALAAARAALARLRGEPELLDAAIADARAAVAEPATHAADPSGPVNSLAMLLAERYDLLGDSANLDESITLHEGLLADPADVAALLGSADIIHLACHCDIDPGYPEETVLQVDPPVRMGDVGVGVLDARTHVVLSACDAALTATSLPDEALSPATAFLLSGARTVTAPVWPVDDEAAAGLMVDYHRRLAVGTEPGQALSQVQAAWSASRPAFGYAPWVVVLRPQGTAAS